MNKISHAIIQCRNSMIKAHFVPPIPSIHCKWAFTAESKTSFTCWRIPSGNISLVFHVDHSSSCGSASFSEIGDLLSVCAWMLLTFFCSDICVMSWWLMMGRAPLLKHESWASTPHSYGFQITTLKTHFAWRSAGVCGFALINAESLVFVWFQS